MVRARTTLTGIIGRPVGHSLSPDMHNAAFAALGMDWAYVPLHVEPEKLSHAVRGISALGFRGVNVTVPHKEAVIGLVDDLSPHASEIGAVNTLTVADGRISGENTDRQGFLDDLEEAGFDPSGKEVIILGAGGSARAVTHALASCGASIHVAARNIARARALVAHLEEVHADARVGSLSLDELAETRDSWDLLVNTTPVGMTPFAENSPWPETAPFPDCALVYDLVYSPRTTRLMEQALGRGIRAVNGLGMLVHQAALSFRIWTGRKAPLEVMKKAVLQQSKPC